jgi:hypothetical protein
MRYIAPTGTPMNEEKGKYGTKLSWLILKYYPSICLEDRGFVIPMIEMCIMNIQNSKGERLQLHREFQNVTRLCNSGLFRKGSLLK